MAGCFSSTAVAAVVHRPLMDDLSQLGQCIVVLRIIVNDLSASSTDSGAYCACDYWVLSRNLILRRSSSSRIGRFPNDIPTEVLAKPETASAI
jgi:hypothetical protein